VRFTGDLGRFTGDLGRFTGDLVRFDGDFMVISWWVTEDDWDFKVS